MANYHNVHGYALTSKEKQQIEVLLPSLHVDLHSTFSKTFAYTYLRSELRQILHSYLNGGFSKAGFALYPLVKQVSKENKQRMMRVQKVARSLQKRESVFVHAKKWLQKSPASSVFSTMLSDFYKDLDQLKKPKTKVHKKKKCKPFSSAKQLKPTKELVHYVKKHLKEDLHAFYIHGSMATQDYIRGYSDLDTLTIVKKETIRHPKKLSALRKKIFAMRKFFYRVDPLQHHGTMVLSQYDLETYPNHVFPVQLFPYAQAVLTDPLEKIRLVQDKSQALATLFYFVHYFRKAKQTGCHPKSAYEIKNMLHFIALFPSLYLQAKGKPCYKKHSFTKFKKEFPRHYQPFQTMTAMRKNWKSPPILPGITKTAHINPVSSHHMNMKLIDRAYKKQLNIDSKALIEQMNNTAEVAWEKVFK